MSAYSDSLTTSQNIPRSLAPFFQEYDLEKLDPHQHWELIVERTLAYGNRQELRWLFRRYGEPAIADWVRRMGWRRLPRRRFNLWCVLLEIEAPHKPPLWEQRIWPH